MNRDANKAAVLLKIRKSTSTTASWNHLFG